MGGEALSRFPSSQDVDGNIAACILVSVVSVDTRDANRGRWDDGGRGYA